MHTPCANAAVTIADNDFAPGALYGGNVSFSAVFECPLALGVHGAVKFHNSAPPETNVVVILGSEAKLRVRERERKRK